jgi:hypothetical protein
MLDYRVEYKPTGEDWRIAGWYGADLVGAVRHGFELLKQPSAKVEAVYIAPESEGE